MSADPERVVDPAVQQFAEMLGRYRLQCGGPSVRDLVRLTAKAGKPLTRATISAKLNARSVPDWEFVEAFVQACAASAGRQADLKDWLQRFRQMRAQRERPAGRRTTKVTFPIRVGLVPPPVDCFQPRDVHLGPVPPESPVSPGERPVRGQILSGPGGVGKTQLAADCARRRWDAKDVDLLIWVTAASRGQIVDGYAEAAAQLDLGDLRDAERAASRLLSWLADTDRRWLVVLDDLAEPGDLSGLWPPTTPAGASLVTTRRRDAALHRPDVTLLPVGLFTPAEARSYLLEKLTGTGEDVGQIDGLAADLGFLPLALAQATAYLSDRDLTCAQYRARFADRKRTLAQLVPEPGSLPDEHQATVAATWSLSIEVADALTPAGVAKPLLLLASLLNPDDIPTALFARDEILAWMGTRGTRGTRGTGSPVSADDVNDGLRNLHRLNLATVTPETVRVHSLVQRATREVAHRNDYGAQAWRQTVRALADAVVALANAGRSRRYLTELLWHNVRALMQHGEAELWHPDGHPVLYGFGDSLGHAGQIRAAAEHFLALAEAATEHLGPTHDDTLLARARHAHWLAGSGRLIPAAAELEQVIAARTARHGPDHPSTFVEQANRATFLGDAGDAGDARAAFAEFTRLVERRTAVLGPDDADTLVTRGNQARWRGEAGDREGAVQAYTDLVPLFTRTFGATDPRTLHVRVQLASWRGELDPATGVEEFEQLLALQAVTFGAYHHETLSTRRNRAVLRSRAGQPELAIAELVELIAVYQQHDEPDHPEALRVRTDLAECLIAGRGDVTGGHRLLAALVADARPALGDDHPITARAARMLAVIEKEMQSVLAQRLTETFVPATSVSTTLARLTGGTGLDLLWVRHALAALAAEGHLLIRRDGQAPDLLSLGEHARFHLTDTTPAAPEFS